jgi:O-antigen/teichoic acid export membrane protein
MPEVNRAKLSLRVNFSWTLISNIIFAFSQWLILVIIAKFGTPEEVGSYSLGLAISAPLFLLASLQLRTMQVTDVRGVYKFYNFYTLRIISSVIAMMILLTLLLFLDYSTEIKVIILLVGVTKFIDSLSDVIHGLFQKNERMDYISKSKILRSVLSILGFTLTLSITRNLIYAIIVMAVFWFLIFVFVDLKKAKIFDLVKVTINKKAIFKITRTTLPLGLATMMISLNTNIPRYILESYSNIGELGFFTSIVYIVVSGNTIVNSLGQSAAPRLSRYYTENNLIGFKHLLKKLIFIGFSIGIAGIIVTILFGKELLTIIYTPQYAEYSPLLIISMIAGLFMYVSTFFGFSITATKNFKIQPYLGGVWLLTSILVSFMLIPKYGIIGAGITLIITSACQLMTQAVFILFFFRKKHL